MVQWDEFYRQMDVNRNSFRQFHFENTHSLSLSVFVRRRSGTKGEREGEREGEGRERERGMKIFESRPKHEISQLRDRSAAFAMNLQTFKTSEIFETRFYRNSCEELKY